MNYLLVPDKFKGSLTSKQVIDALSKGILRADDNALLFNALVSDGGDGFLESIAQYTNSEFVTCETQDPLGEPMLSDYLYNSETKSAYIEMAKTAGLELLSKSQRSPMVTSTYGTGLQIKHALEAGAENVYVGLGGSATNDAGLGIAMALGYQFLDREQNLVAPIGQNLVKISRIKKPEDEALYKKSEIFAINDVNNPLFGPEGAAFIYAAQKGASENEQEYLDQGLRQLDALVVNELSADNSQIPGAGAAGGTAYGLMTFLGARFLGGTDFILRIAGVPDIIKNQHIDYFITGEGKIDNQTLSGKLIHGILELGKLNKIPVIAICGALDENMGSLTEKGLAAVIEVRDRSQTLEYNMENAVDLVEEAICNYFSKRN